MFMHTCVSICVEMVIAQMQRSAKVTGFIYRDGWHEECISEDELLAPVV